MKQALGRTPQSRKFEEVQGQRVATDEITTNEFGQDVLGDLKSGHGFDYAEGDHEDGAEHDAVEHDERGGVGIPELDCPNAIQGEQDEQHNKQNIGNHRERKG